MHMQPVPREHLCYLFWSDKPESQARRNLSHLLTHLRRALPASDDILSVDDQIALNGSLVWSGVAGMALVGIARAYDIDFDKYLSDFGRSLLLARFTVSALHSHVDIRRVESLTVCQAFNQIVHG